MREKSRETSGRMRIAFLVHAGDDEIAVGDKPDSRHHRVSKVVWLKPELVGTAHFMHEMQSGGMRQPVWKGLREDK